MVEQNFQLSENLDKLVHNSHEGPIEDFFELS